MNTPTDRFYLPQLDGLRFMAFFLVFLHHHIPAPLSGLGGDISRTLHDFGWMGVELFFALSAFLMTTLLLKEHAAHGSIGIGRFFVRRILRIWPLYFFLVFLGFVVLPLMGGGDLASAEYRRLISSYLVPYLLLFGNVAVALSGYPDAASIGAGNLPWRMATDALSLLWTISAEEQFYVVLPFMLAALAGSSTRRWVALLLGVSLFGLGVRFGMYVMPISTHPAMWVLPVARPDSFLVGIGIAIALRHGAAAPSWRPVVSWAILAAAAALLLLVVQFPSINHRSWHQMWQYPVLSIGIGGVLLAFVMRPPVVIASLFRARLIVYLGKISYGLYVYHLMSLTVMRELFARMGYRGDSSIGLWLAQSATALALTVAVSAISYRWLESPFLQFKVRFERIHGRPV